MTCASFGAAVSHAQDQQNQSVAEAARQERARKQEQQKTAKHVYTEEDLKHPQILTPEDRAIVEAKRNDCAQKNNCSPASAQNSPASLDAGSQTPQIPLGDVARKYRAQKELQALKPKQPEPFHLPFSTPALASPVLPERPTIRPPTQLVFRSKTPSNVFRRDPFSAVPVRPEIRRTEIRHGVRQSVRPAVRLKMESGVSAKVREHVFSVVRPHVRPDFSKDVRPALRAPGRLLVPAQPKVFSRAAPLSILAPTAQPTILAKASQPAVPVETVRSLRSLRPIPSTGLASQRTVSVMRGDSLWKLAQQNLGRGSRWTELLEANRWITNPNQIRVGAQLYIPLAAATPRSLGQANGDAKPMITVHKGDTLWTLAKANLGRSSYWPCLAAANPAVGDPNLIYENQELLIPTGCGP